MSGNQANQTSDAYWSNQLNESVQHNVVLHHRIEALANQRAALRAMRDRQNLDGQRPTQSVGSMVARYENLSERSATNATPGAASRSTAEQTPTVTSATTAATPAAAAAPATAPATATTQSQQQMVEQLTAENARLRAALAVQTAPVEVPSTRLETIAETAEASERAELSAGLWQRPVVVEKKPQVDEYGFWAKVE